MADSTDREQLHTWLPSEVSRALNAHAEAALISRAAMARQVISAWASANPAPVPEPTSFNLVTATAHLGYDEGAAS